MATMGIRIVRAGNNSAMGYMYVVFIGDDGSVITIVSVGNVSNDVDWRVVA